MKRLRVNKLISQSLNSEVLNSNIISNATKEDLANIAGICWALGTKTYLGVPSMVVKSKKATL
jgi:hypothetical protein